MYKIYQLFPVHSNSLFPWLEWNDILRVKLLKIYANIEELFVGKFYIGSILTVLKQNFMKPNDGMNLKLIKYFNIAKVTYYILKIM